jgi:hypothetical protein
MKQPSIVRVLLQPYQLWGWNIKTIMKQPSIVRALLQPYMYTVRLPCLWRLKKKQIHVCGKVNSWVRVAHKIHEQFGPSQTRTIPQYLSKYLYGCY